jgi:hypothetical protein
MHPDLTYELIHENSSGLVKSHNIGELYEKLTYPAKQEGKETGSIMSIKSGQKIPYTSFKNAMKYIETFRNFFPESSIIHIVRDPIDTISSQMKFKNKDLINIIKLNLLFLWNTGRFNYYMKRYFNSVPKVKELLKNDQLFYEVKYEALIMDVQLEINKLYEWLGGEVDLDHIERVISTKEPWEYKGRIMPGLRYFNKIENRISKNIILNQNQIKTVNQLAKKHEIV